MSADDEENGVWRSGHRAVCDCSTDLDGFALSLLLSNNSVLYNYLPITEHLLYWFLYELGVWLFEEAT